MKIVTTAQNIRIALLSLLFPERCVSCDQLGQPLCDECRKKIDFVASPLCPLCGYPSEGLCHRCQHSPLDIDGIRSVAFFEGPVRQAMHALKYRGLRTVVKPLSGLMSDYWQRNPLPADVIVPVPLHRRRLRERGYNQAALLARALAAEIGLPVREKWLVRIRATFSQIELDASERKKNVSDAFQCPDHNVVAGRQILLIDDVCTTGATLESCSLALGQAGAQSVWAFTLGRAR